VDTARDRTYRGVVTSPGDQYRPDDGRGPRSDQPDPRYPAQGYPYGPTPYDPAGGNGTPPYVYNPYGNVAYPSTYPAPPAGLGPDDDRLPARRPGSLHLALVLLVVAALPYLLGGLLAVLGAGSAAAAVPPEQLAQLQELGVDIAQVLRTAGVIVLVVALVFVLLAVLAWTGRRWARALLTALTVGFVLMVFVFVAASSSQGVPVDAGSLLVLAGPTVLAVIGLVLMFRPAAREWFARPRR
jgi:hypothetical protein